MYLLIQDAVAPRENNNLRCLLLQAQHPHTYLGWQEDLVLAEQAGTGAIIVEDYCCGASGSLLDQPRQILASCTCLCSQVYWTTLHSHSRPMPCLELQSKMKMVLPFASLRKTASCKRFYHFHYILFDLLYHLDWNNS